MTRQIPDDRRYMTFEVRATDDARYRGAVKRTEKPVTTCFCGKTVVATYGRPTGVTCPRGCEKERS